MNKIHCTALFLSLVLFFGIGFEGQACVCESTGNGNWNNTGTWSCGTVPTNGCFVIIQSGHTVTISTDQYNTASAPNLFITVKGTFAFSSNNKIYLGEDSWVRVEGGQAVQSGTGQSNECIGSDPVPGNGNAGIYIDGDHVWQGNTCGAGPRYINKNNNLFEPDNFDFLPVTLTQFTGNATNSRVSLNWQVASEEKFSHYEIERSGDGRGFHKIGQVNGKGSNYQTTDYQFHDNNPNNRTLYYRLKMVDLDGTFEHSKIVAIQVNIQESFQVYPNPSVGGQVNLLLSNGGFDQGRVEFYNQMGSMVYHTDLQPEQMEQEIKPMTAIPTGMYIVKILVDGNVSTQRLVVQ